MYVCIFKVLLSHKRTFLIFLANYETVSAKTIAMLVKSPHSYILNNISYITHPQQHTPISTATTT